MNAATEPSERLELYWVGPGPARDAIVNFAEVAHAYTDRLERRARAGTDPMLRALADRAHQHVADILRPRHDATNPTLRIQLRIDEQTTLSMLAAVVRFEHATDITVAELSSVFSALTGQRQLVAIAQIVCTLTSQPGIGQVAFTLDGEPVDVPKGDGSTTSAPVAADDYQHLG
jgi:hypothetical protein